MVKWDPCGCKRPGLSTRGRCAECRDLRQRHGSSLGGKNGSLRVKRDAGRLGGAWAAFVRRTNRKVVGDKYVTASGQPARFASGRIVYKWSCDLTFTQLVAEMDRMDERKKAGATRLTSNLILEYAFFERTVRVKDAVFKELHACVRVLCRGDREAGLLPSFRLIAAVVFTQARRGTARQLLSVVRDQHALEGQIGTVKCGCSTFHGVVTREHLQEGAMEAVARYMYRVLSRKRRLANMAAVVDGICEVLWPWVSRNATFHAWEMCLHSSHLRLGFRQALVDGGYQVCERTGSRVGATLVQKQEGRSSRPSVEDLAAELGWLPDKVQTSLCVYGKYHRWYHQGIGRWYKEMPACMMRN